MPHTICHLEIPTTDVKESGEFYKLFGWEIDYGMGKDYAIFSTGEGQLTGGGLDSSEQTRSIGSIIIYILVDDIDTMLERAVKLGAKKAKEKTEIPNIGWYGLFTDLDDNTIGLFTQKK